VIVPLELDLTAWPVALLARPVVAETVDATVDVVEVGPVLGSLFDRKERFGLVLDLGRQNEAEQAALAQWLQRNRTRARRYVVGCALVLPAGAIERGRELIGARPDLYPFPAWVAASRDECRHWVEGVLASSGPRGGRLRR
jgi:hypothetical protein